MSSVQEGERENDQGGDKRDGYEARTFQKEGTACVKFSNYKETAYLSNCEKFSMARRWTVFAWEK